MAHVFGVQKALQAFGCAQTVKNVQFFLFAQGRFAADGFKLLLPPALLVLVGGVHVLGTNRAAVGLSQGIHELAQAHGFLAEKGIAGVEHGFLIGIAETVERQLQFRDFVAFCALERVQVSPTDTHIAVGRDQLLHGCALAAHFKVYAGNHHAGLTAFGAFCKSVDNGQVRYVLGVGSIDCSDMLQCIEILTPAVQHAAGVGEVVFVHLLNIGRVAAEKVRIARIGGVR